jgi:hypothetical protein
MDVPEELTSLAALSRDWPLSSGSVPKTLSCGLAPPVLLACLFFASSSKMCLILARPLLFNVFQTQN